MSIVQLSHLIFGANSVVSYVVMLVSFVVGAMSLTAGYRIVKAMVFLVAFAISATIASFFVHGFVAVAIGLIVGSFCLACWYVGLFALGMGMGLLVAAAVGVNNSPVALIFGVIGGALALAIRKFMIIVSTSFVGAFLLMGVATGIIKGINPVLEHVLVLVLALCGIGCQYQSGKGKNQCGDSDKKDKPVEQDKGEITQS